MITRFNIYEVLKGFIGKPQKINIYARNFVYPKLSKSRNFNSQHQQTQSCFSQRKFHISMMKEVVEKRTYEDAIECLNTLQTNATVLEQMKKDKQQGTYPLKSTRSIPDMKKFLKRLQIDINDLDKLNIIHISGTKGKGSVSAFSESILRNLGLKTGFYSSPHLVEVRERIQINGMPLDKELFAKYFFQCYERLIETLDESNPKLPGYFRFLTLMAFHVYLQEKVDLVVLEVGLGGTYDCTNVIQKPIVCGITKLEIDHAAVLGKNIEQIATHKAGIMKPGRPALTIAQVKEAESVLFQRSEEHKANLFRIPLLSMFPQNFPEFGLKGDHQKINAAMAIQLARIWCYEKRDFVTEQFPDKIGELDNILKTSPFEVTNADVCLSTFKIPSLFLKGLNEVKWLGRCQYFKQDDKFSFYLDGAHTTSSIEAFVSWFKSVDGQHSNTFPPSSSLVISRVLMFFITGEREADMILQRLSEIEYDFVIFCPTMLGETKGGARGSSDLVNRNLSKDSRLRKCFELEQRWLLQGVEGDEEQMEATAALSNATQKNLRTSSRTAIFPSISSAMEWIWRCSDKEQKAALTEKDEIPSVDNLPDYPIRMLTSSHVQVLVTGSFHLVGGVLKCLGPDAYIYLTQGLQSSEL